MGSYQNSTASLVVFTEELHAERWIEVAHPGGEVMKLRATAFAHYLKDFVENKDVTGVSFDPLPAAAGEQTRGMHSSIATILEDVLGRIG